MENQNVRQNKFPGQTTDYDPDEINLLEYVYVLIKHKKLILGLTLFGLIAGYVAAIHKGPTWAAEAVIAPKERESQKATSLADLGAIGGLVASQLNLDAGSASLNMMEMIIDSREFGASLIENKNLLPVIYKYQFPEKYQKYWDKEQNNWRPGFVKPNLFVLSGMVKTRYVKKIKDPKKNTLVLSIRSKDSLFSYTLATVYVKYLSEYIKTKVQNEAKENAEYLDSELVTIEDPVLRAKILGLLSSEIEKKMIVSREAFKVMDPVFLKKEFKIKRLYPLMCGGSLFAISIVLLILFHAIASGIKTEADQVYLKKISKELLKF